MNLLDKIVSGSPFLSNVQGFFNPQQRAQFPTPTSGPQIVPPPAPAPKQRGGNGAFDAIAKLFGGGQQGGSGSSGLIRAIGSLFGGL